MPKRTSRDFNQIAKAVVDAVAEASERSPDKNPAAVALGRLGGLKGGPARARRLSSRQRVKIASKAARARWGKK
jgi:hypothetical protein